MLTLKYVITWVSGCFCCKRVVNRSFLILFYRIILYVYRRQYNPTPTQLNGKSTYNFAIEVWTNPTYSITKKAGIVYIDYYCIVTEGYGGTAYSIAKLPEALIPHHRIRSAAWSADAKSKRNAANVDIYTDGTVKIITGGDFVEAGFSVSYPL